MRIWDAELLTVGKGAKCLLHETVAVETDYTFAGAIYTDFFRRYESLGTNLFLCAVIRNNTASNSYALQSVYVVQNAAETVRAFNERSRTIRPGDKDSAYLYSGSTIDIYYVAFDSADDVFGKTDVASFALTATKAYSLSSDINNDFIAPSVQATVPNGYKYAAILLPDTPAAVSKYLQCMSYNNLLRANGKFMRYNNTVYGVSSSFDAKLDSGDTLKLLIFDYTGTEERS